VYWQEETDDAATPARPDEIVDVTFPLQGRTVPVDHAEALARALEAVLPWLAGEAGAGVHAIHVAASQNGWQRPEEAGAVLHISRRTRMALRLPAQRVADAHRLSGAVLDLAGHLVTVGTGSVRPLLPLSTLFARRVVAARDRPEGLFVEEVAEELRRAGVRPRKLLCGKAGEVQTAAGPMFTRSLMVADLGPDESVLLQRIGVGPGRRLGCGLFVPHKGISSVRPAAGDS
jgi:CRISPR-associated protein Cas6